MDLVVVARASRNMELRIVPSNRAAMTLKLDHKWMQRSAHDALLTPLLVKLQLPYSAIESVELDGKRLTPTSLEMPVRQLLPHPLPGDRAPQVDVQLDESPVPANLKLAASSAGVSVKLELDHKWMQRPLRDAVVAPLLSVCNKRAAKATTASSLLELHVDGVKQPDAKALLELPTERALGYRCSRVDLFFSHEAIRSAAKPPVPTHKWRGLAPDTFSADLEWNNLGLNASDALQMTKQLLSLSPLKALKYAYIYQNKLGDDGIASIARALKREHAPALLQLHLHSNGIGSAGAIALARECSPSPSLEVLSLNDNMIGDDGADALADALSKKTLSASVLVMHGNPAISTAARKRLLAACPGCTFDKPVPGTGPTPYIPLNHTPQRWVTASDVA